MKEGIDGMDSGKETWSPYASVKTERPAVCTAVPLLERHTFLVKVCWLADEAPGFTKKLSLIEVALCLTSIVCIRNAQVVGKRISRAIYSIRSARARCISQYGHGMYIKKCEALPGIVCHGNIQ
jgi:hypothetical protein